MQKKKPRFAPAEIPNLSQSELTLATTQALFSELQAQMDTVMFELDHKVSQLEELSRFSALLNSSLDTTTVREKALEATCRLLNCQTASLLLVDAKRGELYWDSALGEAGKQLKGAVRLPINNRSIAGYVAMTGEAVMSHHVANDPRHFKKIRTSSSFETRTMLCVPLLSRGQVIGVIQAINKLSHAEVKQTELQKKVGWPCFSGDDQQLFTALAHQVAIAIDNSVLFTNMKQGFFETVEALAEAIEKKDQYTGGHAKRVVYFSLLIGKHMNLLEEQMDQLRLGALLHDVGKIGVEDKILKKDSPLDEAEWKVMQRHPEFGYDILQNVQGFKEIVSGMRFHHERWDGKGYPLGLKGEEIPLIARIISVADTYDAMVSTRPYRKGLPALVAFEEILKYRGTQFDPDVVDAFARAFQTEKMGKGSGGSRHGLSGSIDITNALQAQEE